MTTITNFSNSDLPQRYRDMLDGKLGGRPLTAQGIKEDLQALTAAKARVKALVSVPDDARLADYIDLAANEIERLRAQVAELTADALVRANRQSILVNALRTIATDQPPHQGQKGDEPEVQL